MSYKTVTIDQPEIYTMDTLGEAPVWDSIRQKLYWVDIDGRRVHWFHPKTGRRCFRQFAYKISAIACTTDNSGLVAAIDDGFAIIPFSVLFANIEDTAQVKILHQTALQSGEKRFNEGMADPCGRFLAGTMGFAHGTHDGRMFALRNGKVEDAPVLEGITCTNGMAWIDSGNTMYFTDSWDKRIDKFDYDLDTGRMSGRRPFVELDTSAWGWPDGLCVDSQGGVWSARWGAGKVIRLTEGGEIDLVLDFPRAWNMTSCVFGGENMDILYVTSADTDIEGNGPAGRPDGGSLYAITGLGFSGAERHRYAP